MSTFKAKDREDHTILSDGGGGETFEQILKRHISRRNFLKTVAITSALNVAGASCVSKMVVKIEREPKSFPLGFSPIVGNNRDTLNVPIGHTVKVLLRWGDPILPDAPDFDLNNMTAEAQAMQFGYNCDFVGYFPFPTDPQVSIKGLLVVNHEYTNQELMFPDYDIEQATKEQVDIEMGAHGLSIVELYQDSDCEWHYDQQSSFNRRLTLKSLIMLEGPVAHHQWVKTSDDPPGIRVLGTLNNCSGGKTPWGTVLTGEENFQLYFGNQKLMAEGEIKDVHARYGLQEGAPSLYRWLDYYPRFDVAQEANEAFRFGWIVEVDPYDPDWTPRKRTALGRFRHEAATVVVTPDNRVVIYSGDDQRFEYVYKFVSKESYDPTDREANRDGDLLNDGILYVAKFYDDGTGEWLPLVYRENGLQGTVTIGEKEYTFNSQADVLLKTRLAADYLGATKMDRPEDVETNPVTGQVYIALTNNTRRGTEGNPEPDAANPRGPNPNGHIIELTHQNNGDHTATSFKWQIFMLCGRPSDEDTEFADFPKEDLNQQFSGIAAPDNITFDDLGNLWIATDGQPSALTLNDGLFAVPVEGSQRGHIGQFFCSVIDSEVCGPEFTPDYKSLFLAIQHPGDGGDYHNPTSRWPDYDQNIPPRPSVIVIQTVSPDGTIGHEKVGQLAQPYRSYIPMAMG